MVRYLKEQSKSFEREEPKPGLKRAVNVSVDADVLRIAKEMGLGPSQILEDELRRLTKSERIRRWREENREALDSYNALIERAGVFGEEFQDWDDDAV